MSEIFGKDSYYLELQNHGYRADGRKQRAAASSQGDRNSLVVTNDAHYINKSDAYNQDVLMCIQTQNTVSDTDRLKFETDEFYIKSEEEMRALFPDWPEAADNTEKIAGMCNFAFRFGTYHLPEFKLPEGETDSFEYLRRLCLEGLKKRYGGSWEKYLDRLDFELKTISEMGFVEYFLIVGDYVAFAKNNGIPVGPGRGSAGGSIVAYCLGITDIDPVKYGLVFERFLNPERISMPDIDIDFCEKEEEKSSIT